MFPASSFDNDPSPGTAVVRVECIPDDPAPYLIPCETFRPRRGASAGKRYPISMACRIIVSRLKEGVERQVFHRTPYSSSYSHHMSRGNSAGRVRGSKPQRRGFESRPLLHLLFGVRDVQAPQDPRPEVLADRAAGCEVAAAQNFIPQFVL